MIEVQNSKHPCVKQESNKKMFKLEKSQISKADEKQTSFTRGQNILGMKSRANPLLVRDKKVATFKTILNQPR